MPQAPSMDKLTGQLYHLPAIIGRMGLSIANAQKAFNLDYLNNVSQLLQLIKETTGTKDDTESMRALLEALAPSRHQFTEATLDFSADLAETMDIGAQGGLGFGTAAITVNAAFALSYGYDYRAAARISVKMHAIPANPELIKEFLNRAKAIDKAKLALPARSEVEDRIVDAAKGVHQALPAKAAPAPTSAGDG